MLFLSAAPRLTKKKTDLFLCPSNIRRRRLGNQIRVQQSSRQPRDLQVPRVNETPVPFPFSHSSSPSSTGKMGTHFPAYSVPPFDCTPPTCPLREPRLTYAPSLPGNASYLAFFSVMLLVQLAMGIRYRTWGYMAAMVSGLVLEAIGYAGRIQLHYNRFQLIPFREYAVPGFNRIPVQKEPVTRQLICITVALSSLAQPSLSALGAL